MPGNWKFVITINGETIGVVNKGRLETLNNFVLMIKNTKEHSWFIRNRDKFDLNCCENKIWKNTFGKYLNTVLCHIKVNSNTIELIVHTSCYCV